ncbi:MAG: glycosyl-4,4'-diaponeurosporenoate acyltransferase [Clostridia bacterium]|nr:glycosyl-4,4'-diaponeurosporenoate acyltransferase [Clostridia bacterium]
MKFVQCLIYLAAIGLLSQIAGMLLPRRLFKARFVLFHTAGWEKGGRVYERLGVRRWKDRLPDMSRIVKRMQPKQIKAAFTKETAENMLAETCVAEAVHISLAVLGVGCVFIWKRWGYLIWGLYAIGNIPFIIIQRYNRPRYIIAIKRFEERERRTAESTAVCTAVR